MCDPRPRKRKSSSYPKTIKRDNCSRREYPKTTATKNSRVRANSTPKQAARAKLIRDRHADSMDRAEWHRHGPQLPGARGLCQHMVCETVFVLADIALMQDRDFVNEVQSRLQALAQGRRNHHVCRALR